MKTLSILFLISLLTLSISIPLYYSWPTYFDTGLLASLAIFLFEAWVISGMIVQQYNDYPREVEVPDLILNLAKFIYITGILLYIVCFGLIIVGAVWGAWQDRYIILQCLMYLGLVCFVILLVWISIEQIFKRRR